MTDLRWWTIVLSFAFATAFAQTDASAVAKSQQLVVVITADWSSNQGALYRFERNERRWKQLGSPVAVSIGAKGSAWGLGVHPAQDGPQKAEGDGRSPAGLFMLGAAFGYSNKERSTLPYQAMTSFDYCVDVSESPHYNRIVDERAVGRAAIAGTTEPMRRDLHADGDQRYKLGFVIEHNSNAVPAKGSCIFAHLWNSPGQTTAGCTAMDEKTMRALLTWLDPSKRPLFVLLPRAEYGRVAQRSGLPSPDESVR